ncbi:MAG: hypothetical protein IJP30_04290 [Clostridia bacterium]|nr:hypothetical protein [Clostridia bacterium]
MTYKEIKDQVFQLMFGYSVDGENRLNARENKDAMLALPGAVTRGLQDLAMSTAPIEVPLCITLQQIEPLDYETETEETEQGRGYTVYCEDCGGYRLCSRSPMDVKEDWVDDNGIPAAIGRYTVSAAGEIVARALKGRGRLRLTFLPTQGDVLEPDMVFYSGIFNTPAALPVQSGVINLCALVKERGYHDVIGLRPMAPAYLNGADVSRFIAVPAQKLIYLPDGMEGQLTLYVRLLPKPITADTPDDYVPEIAEEALSLVPYYAAARLFLEDDPNLSELYYRRYQDEKAVLPQTIWRGVTERFQSVTGWA